MRIEIDRRKQRCCLLNSLLTTALLLCGGAQLRGQESNLRLLVQSQASLPAATTPHRFARDGRDSNPRWYLTGTCSAAELPTQGRVPCGNRTRLARLEAWHLCRSAKGTLLSSGRRGSRTLKAFDARPLSKRLPSPIGLPFRYIQAAVAGIEPASGRLTAACPYQHGPHRNTSVRMAGFEPAVSCSRGTRHCQAFPHPEIKERPAGVEPAHPPWQGSRLPLHHGRLLRVPNCQRSRAPGGTRTHVAALRVRNLRR